MGGRHGPHAINAGEELLEMVVDELRGLRDDMARHFAPVAPEPPAPEAKPEESSSPVAINITEPALAPAAQAKAPAKKTAAKRQPVKEVPDGDN